MVALLLGLLPVALAARAERAATWRLDSPPADESGATAVAASDDGRWALGDGRGAWLRETPGPWRRLDLRGAVRDLAFAPDGALWIASAQGLLRFAGGRLVERAPAPGDEDRDALRVATSAHAVAVVTADGIHWSRDGVRFARVTAALGDSSAAAIALEEDESGAAQLWIACERGLLIAALPAEGDVKQIVASDAPVPVDLRPALDVAVAGGRVLALGRSFLLERAPGGAFRAVSLGFPPGATPMRVAASEAVMLVATDRGVVAAPTAAGPWRRVAPPAGSTPAQDVAITGEQALIASSRGLLVGTPRAEAVAEETEASNVEPPRSASCDPPVREVQRAALRYLRLAGDPAGEMRRGVRLRGLLPIVSVEATRSRATDTRLQHDAAYISGGYRNLDDRDENSGIDRQVQLRLSWDLGGTLYNPEQVDVSTEARRLIELRDDVLDELDQLYFDRRRALDASQAAAPDSQEEARERLRAEELGAGLDAWTDGWFGTQAGRSPCAGP